MQRKTAAIIGAVALAGGAIVAGATIAGAGGKGEDQGPDRPISGSALDQATAAALAETGEGRVTDTEVGDEESYYEVEVTLEDGRQVDVQLDKAFEVVGSRADHEDDADD